MQDQSGLSIADFSVLVQLSEHADGRMRVLELARGLRWEKSRLSHQLTRMQQRGLIERSNCNEDRRGAFVVLTDQGRAHGRGRGAARTSNRSAATCSTPSPPTRSTSSGRSRPSVVDLARRARARARDDCRRTAADAGALRAESARFA